MSLRSLRFLAAVCSFAVLTAACSGSKPAAPGGTPPVGSTEGKLIKLDGETVTDQATLEAAKQEGKVVYYTTLALADEQKQAQDFNKAFPGIQVDIVRAPSGQMIQKVLTESQTGNLQADVILFSDLGFMDQLMQKNLMEKWLPPMDSAYDAKSKNSGFWYSPFNATLLIEYNNKVVPKEQAPKAWKDLLDPKWQGKIGMVPPSLTGVSRGTLYFLKTQLGDGYLTALAKQKIRFYESGSTLSQAIAKGEVPIGINGNGFGYKLRVVDGAPLEVVYPEEGTGFTGYAMGLVKGGKNANAAKLFLSWYLSKQGQEAIVAGRGAYSSRKDVAPAKGNKATSELKLFPVPDDPSKLQEFNEKTNVWVKEFNDLAGYK